MVFNMFTENIPKLDLHGESSDIARVLIKNFIYENHLLKIPKVIIVHGKGDGILKKETHNSLKNNKYVSKYYINMFNTGSTIAELYDNIDRK